MLFLRHPSQITRREEGVGGRTVWFELRTWLVLSPCLSHLPVSSRKKAVEAKCSLACEYLSEEDYMDLLWTTLSEFPGEGRVGSGHGASRIPGAAWEQIPFPGGLGIIFSTLSCKLSGTVKGLRFYSA